MRKKSFYINKGLYFVNVEKYANMPLNELQSKKIFLKFSIWAFLLLISVIAINALLISEIAFWAIDKGKIISNWENIPSDGNVDYELIWRSNLVQLIIDILLPIIMLVTLVLSLQKCIKSKSYGKISFLPTILIFIQTIIGFMSLISFAINSVSIIAGFRVSWIYLCSFIMNFVYLFVWFFISRNVAIIRKIYMIAEYKSKVEETQQGVFGDNSNFDVFNDTNTQSNQSQNTSKHSNNFNTNDSFYLRLKSLSREQLNDIAKSLSISGYETMKDEELIQIITDIRNVQKMNTTEKEIEIEKDENQDDESSENKVN